MRDRLPGRGSIAGRWAGTFLDRRNNTKTRARELFKRATPFRKLKHETKDSRRPERTSKGRTSASLRCAVLIYALGDGFSRRLQRATRSELCITRHHIAGKTYLAPEVDQTFIRVLQSQDSSLRRNLILRIHYGSPCATTEIKCLSFGLTTNCPAARVCGGKTAIVLVFTLSYKLSLTSHETCITGI